MGAQNKVDKTNKAGTRPAPTLGETVGAFKSITTTKLSEALNNTIGHRFPGNCGSGIMEPAQSEAEGNVSFETKTN